MKNLFIHKFILYLFFIVLFFHPPLLVKGQTTNEDAAKKYGITYPITSLGNCTDHTSCRNYCEDEAHRDICIQYAKQKGFYEERKTDETLIHAKTELGCNSETECKNVCEKEENFEKCTNFAKKTGLMKEQILSPKNQEILAKAKEILGCDSPQTCKSICEQEGNRQKCSEFAKQTGLKGGEEKRGPGGCNSEESCKAFCSSPDNFNECSKFKPPEGQERRDGPPQEGFKGPGGCTSESSCKEYCEKNPSECQKFGPGPEGKEGERGKPPEGIKREEMEKLCKENPEKCKEQFGGGLPQNTKPENIQLQDREKFCKENPEKCRDQGPPQGSAEFKRPEEFRPPENSQERQGPPSGQNQGPPPEQQNQGQPPQNSSLGPPPEVRGASTIRNIVEKFLYFLFKK